jgi:hypothetical protein
VLPTIRRGQVAPWPALGSILPALGCRRWTVGRDPGRRATLGRVP